MNTKFKVAEQILEFIKYNKERDQRESVDIREVMLRMDQVANQYAKNNYLEKSKEGDRTVAPTYLVPFIGIEIETDDNGMSFIKIPSAYMQLSYGRGITLYEHGSNFRKMILQVNPYAFNGFANSPAGRMEGRLNYFVQQRKAIFCRDVSYGDDLIEKVDAVMAIVDMADLEDDDLYPIDPAVSADFVTDVASYFMAQTQDETKQ